MGRPLKKGLYYFNIDCDQEDNLNYIEAKHGINGYGIVVKLWRKIYMINGYYTEWNEKNIYLFAREINVEVLVINAVVESCLEEGIFNRQLFNDHQVLTSHGIQKRYIKIVTEAKRKDCEIDQKFNLLAFPPENNEFLPEETPEIPEVSTQTKQKENKLNQSKGVAPAKPVLPKKVDAKKIEEESEPYWHQLVEGWFAFGIEKFKVKPSFDRDDPKIFKRIIQRLKKRAADKNVTWDEKTGPRRLRGFLDTAFQDKWLCKNFLLSHLENQFDKFIQNQESQSKKPVQAVADLQYLYERFLEGDLDKRSIVPEHYAELLAKKLPVNISNGVIKKRMEELIGGNKFSEAQLYQDYEAARESKLVVEDKPQLMRIAVLEYFEKVKSKKITA